MDENVRVTMPYFREITEALIGRISDLEFKNEALEDKIDGLESLYLMDGPIDEGDF